MVGAKKLSAAVIAAALLLVGLAACGGDDDSASGTTETAPQATGTAPPDPGSGGPGEDPVPDEGGNGKLERGDDRAEAPAGRRFVPKEHDDSGGGSAQFRVEGGDNSVQEFGEEASESELDAAATALHNFLDARAEGAWDSACSFLASEVKQSLQALAAQGAQSEDTSCSAVLERITNPAALPALRSEAARADVGSLRIEGDRAFVVYRGLKDSILAVPMAREDGSWKVAALAGTPLN